MSPRKGLRARDMRLNLFIFLMCVLQPPPPPMLQVLAPFFQGRAGGGWKNLLTAAEDKPLSPELAGGIPEEARCAI